MGRQHVVLSVISALIVGGICYMIATSDLDEYVKGALLLAGIIAVAAIARPDGNT